MELFQTAPLNCEPATKAGIINLVSCVSKLPELDVSLVGMVCQLTSSQPGYVATHFYMMVSNGGRLSWRDLTSAGTYREVESTRSKYQVVAVDDYDNVQFSMTWVDPVWIGPMNWLYDIVVAKTGQTNLEDTEKTPLPPENIFDGSVLCIVASADAHVSTPYVTSLSSGTSMDHKNVKIRVFHAYDDGSFLFTDMTEK